MDETMTDPLPTWIDEVTKPDPVAMEEHINPLATKIFDSFQYSGR
jgi:hypothetical protein